MRRQNAPDLDRDRLVAASFSVLEAEGLDKLSMRRVAAELGVQAPAIYWHVQDKAELLGLMSRDIYAAAFNAAPAASDWRDWLLTFGATLHANFAAHRDGALLCATARPTAHADPEGQAGRLAASLVALGLDQPRALAYQSVVIALALGCAMFEQNGPMHQYLDRMMPYDSNFDIGLKALVQGLEGP